jgi:hypothetical protein
MHTMNKSLCTYCLTLIFLVSCGGGGGSSAINSPLLQNPVISSFVSSSYSTEINTSITLSWATTNSLSCIASDDWMGSKSNNGSETINLSDVMNYNFTLTCKGKSGTSNAVKSLVVEALNSSVDSIYNEDKDSYCKIPVNDSTEYWIEDFTSNVFNPDVFTYELGNGFNAGDGSWVSGWGNNELQYYTGPGNGYSNNYNTTSNTTENLFIENGLLKIQPIYNDVTPFNDPYCSDRGCDYTWPHTSARVITSGKKIFKNPSRITVCFKVPDGTGHWPAVWFLPQGIAEGSKSWPADGEIDVMEAKGRVASEIGSAIHFGVSGNGQIIHEAESVPMGVNFHDKFHSITFEWTENSIKMYMDTQETPYFDESSSSTAFNNFTYPFNEEFFLLLNVASGGDYDYGAGVDIDKFCHDSQCSNLEDPDRGRLLIDYIEYKSID